MSETSAPAHPVDATPVDAVVLAGGTNRIPLFPGNEPGHKALVELHGKPLLAYVLDALHEARAVGRIVVVGAPDVIALAQQWPEVEGIPEGRSLVDNAWRGLQASRTERALFCNPDQPLLRTEMVDDFMDRALPKDADVVSGWISEETLAPFMPYADHKLANFGDGRFAHANLFLARRDLPQLPGVRERMDGLYKARKNNLRFAWALGPGLFAQFLVSAVLGHLPSLEDTLNQAGEHFHLRLAGVVCPYPEIALDVDEPEDYADAQQRLSAGANPEAKLVAA
jgi:CTP:molybdopterin cytidylyltransferase MocA